MADIQTSLYELNQQIMSSMEPLAEEQLTADIHELATWLSFDRNYYYMLLCHERRDYTLFHFNDTSKEAYKGSQEILETLRNRGSILSIDYGQDKTKGFSIWIRNGEGTNAYYLFPYDAGVVEI